MNNIASNTNNNPHVLYSRGYIYDDFDYFDSLDKLSSVMSQTQLQVQELVLCCKTKRLTSSQNLKKLMVLENTFKNLGLDVYIQVN